ncbi:MAG: ABC transporter permease [Streptococcaceae bacterium]|jgi:putative ABC transport system permease protein|nr:ABC transporter permease [Streptococcaceae bacterium]
MIVSTLGQGLLWGILGLGIFMTFRILDFPDMTTEGSFPLGGAVAAFAIHRGFSPLLATFFGMLAGMIAGFMTGLLYTKGKIPIILSGILVVSASNSVMLFVMGRSVLTLLNYPKLQDSLNFLHLDKNFNAVILGVIMLFILISLMLLFFDTYLGQAYIATGDNEIMARSFGIHTDNMKLLGLCISNGIIALSGALICQNDGYAAVDKGIGVIVIGLAAIIIGEVIFSELTILERLLAIVIGAILYQLLILIVIKLGFDTNYLKIFSSIILAICLIIPELRKKFRLNVARWRK